MAGGFLFCSITLFGIFPIKLVTTVFTEVSDCYLLIIDTLYRYLPNIIGKYQKRVYPTLYWYLPINTDHR